MYEETGSGVIASEASARREVFTGKEKKWRYNHVRVPEDSAGTEKSVVHYRYQQWLIPEKDFWVYPEMNIAMEQRLVYPSYQVNYHKAGAIILRQGSTGEPEFLVVHKKKGGMDEEGSYMTTQGIIPGGCQRIGNNLFRTLFDEIWEELLMSVPGAKKSDLVQWWQAHPPVYLGSVRDAAAQDQPVELKVVEIGLFLVLLPYEPRPSSEIGELRWLTLAEAEDDDGVSNLIRFNLAEQLKTYWEQLCMMAIEWPDCIPANLKRV